ncbi:MAG: SUMF1/EgtB/PvdO family nonheme iron enzyme [Bacteroidetes bacterium]|nr:SUMF1/EgtB/PvdO family nonheme iron enzyme [Bacteroidota bacterium]
MKKAILILSASTLMYFGITSFKDKYESYKGFSLKAFENSLAYIPKGSFHFGPSDEDIPYKVTYEFPSRTVSVDSFCMSKFEVCNGQYLEFLNELLKVDTNLYKSMLPDTLVWREKYSYNEPYVEYYLRHPAYGNYPVVGVNYEQAQSFCVWLTKKYMNEPKRKFKKVKFKLPKSEQWVFAAKGKLDLSPFPWKGIDMQNSKGELLANFLYVDQASIWRDSVYQKNFSSQFEKAQIYRVGGSQGYYYSSGFSKIKGNTGDVTMPVMSFQPNGYGLYNMAGNVEEFMREKGKTHGGSWRDTGFYLLNDVFENYDTLNSTSAQRGFRFVMEFEK